MEILLNIKAKIFPAQESELEHEKRHKQYYQKKLPICYSNDYNITACGLEKCHPFDSCKYGRGI
jgi:hypothetical protein